MTAGRRLLVLGSLLLLLVAAPASAQWAVTDPAVTAKNIARLFLDNAVLTQVGAQARSMFEAARRISAVGVDVTRWLTGGATGWDSPLLVDETRPTGRLPEAWAISHLSPASADGLRVELATLDVLDDAARAALEAVATVRATTAPQRAVLAQAERDLTSDTGSTAALLDAQSGLALLRGRQTAETAQLLVPALALLTAEATRAREADVATLTSQALAASLRRTAFDAGEGRRAGAWMDWSQP